MKKILLLTLATCLNGLMSCHINSSKSENSVEVWKTELIRMRSANDDFTDSFKDHTQYLYLYENGKAELVDSLNDGTVRQSKTTWEIRDRNERNIFLFGYGKESEGILGVAYPIITKNETEFKMMFDSAEVTHIWNLKRIK